MIADCHVRNQENTPLLIVLFYSHHLSIQKGLIFWGQIKCLLPDNMTESLTQCKNGYSISYKRYLLVLASISWHGSFALHFVSTSSSAFQIFHWQQSFLASQIVMNLLLFFVLINKKISLFTSSSGEVRIELFLSKTTYKIWFTELRVLQDLSVQAITKGCLHEKVSLLRNF